MESTEVVLSRTAKIMTKPPTEKVRYWASLLPNGLLTNLINNTPVY